MKDKALKIIELLRNEYNEDRFHFEMNVSMFLAGPNNKGLRVQIMEILTHTKMPATKCGMYAVADKLKADFEQISLF